MFSAAASRKARRICQQISLAAARGGRDAGSGSSAKANARTILPIIALAVLAARFRAAAFFRPRWHQSSRTISVRSGYVNWKIGKLIPHQAVGRLW
jgi:hypothetical protein